MQRKAKILWGVAGGIALLLFINRKKAFSYVLSAEQQAFIDNLNPLVQADFNNLVGQIEASGWQVILTSGFRTDMLYPPKGDYHNYGMAIDLNLWNGGTTYLRSTDNQAAWLATGVPQLAESLGFRWGGRFNDYDAVHFDKGNTYSIADLYNAAQDVYGANWTSYGNQVS